MKLPQRGDVVALQRIRTATAIVWSAQDDTLWLIPVSGCNGQARHRADVRLDALEAAACGISIKLPVARCHQAFDLPASRLAKPAPIGRVPDALVRRISIAVQREAAAQADEARMSFNRAA